MEGWIMDIPRTLNYMDFKGTNEQPAPDLSTYATMVATWRHPLKQPPTEAEMQTAWDEILALPPEVDPDATLDTNLNSINTSSLDPATKNVIDILISTLRGQGGARGRGNPN